MHTSKMLNFSVHHYVGIHDYHHKIKLCEAAGERRWKISISHEIRCEMGSLYQLSNTPSKISSGDDNSKAS